MMSEELEAWLGDAVAKGEDVGQPDAIAGVLAAGWVELDQCGLSRARALVELVRDDHEVPAARTGDLDAIVRLALRAIRLRTTRRNVISRILSEETLEFIRV